MGRPPNTPGSKYLNFSFPARVIVGSRMMCMLMNPEMKQQELDHSFAGLIVSKQAGIHWY